MGDWTKRWGYWIAPTPTRPGIYRLRNGGYLVRCRVQERTGRLRTVIKALHSASLPEAQVAFDALRAEKRAEMSGKRPQKQLFATFAVSRFRARLDEGRIKSAKGREKWEQILRSHVVPAFGQYRCDELRPWHFSEWRSKIALWMRDGYEYERRLPRGRTRKFRTVLSPRTANTWLAIVRVLIAEMNELLDLPLRVSVALQDFDTTQRPTYTDEEPNALTPEWARKFLQGMKRSFPQHYAMTLLGFATGKRPSTLRPLRRTGESSDVDWQNGFVRFRRSHTRGVEVMQGTKTGTRERVYLPDVVLRSLREHVRQLEATEGARGAKMVASEFLFPSVTGRMRSPSCLDKAFATVCESIGLPFAITPRAMRRTFNDLARAAQVHDVVTRSITGHATAEMQVHYSTAHAHEQRKAIAKVINLVAVRKERKGALG